MRNDLADLKKYKYQWTYKNKYICEIWNWGIALFLCLLKNKVVIKFDQFQKPISEHLNDVTRRGG